jgi:protein-L-isoaspartate(D-aspartate) O-methyltransferase
MKADEYALARKRMVEEQIVVRGVQDARVLEVMESVPRHLFISADSRPWAYSDAPLAIGHGQTISQPYIVALMTELLQLSGEECILEIGTGSGYQAAVLSRLVAEVHTVEVIPELAAAAIKTLNDLGYQNVHVHVGDGSSGWPEAAPYEGILVAAAAPAVPIPLLTQLAESGRLVLPVGSSGFQQLEVWTCKGQEYKREVNLPVSFVPLRGKYGWK